MKSETKTKKRGHGRIIIAAILIFVVIAAAGYFAYKYDIASLRTRISGAKAEPNQTDDTVKPQTKEDNGLFFVQGLENKPEYLAAQQLREFNENYDYSWRDESGVYDGASYSNYDSVYDITTMYMQYKLGQIAENNGLTPAYNEVVTGVAEMMNNFGVFDENSRAYAGYIYNGGSTVLEGQMETSGNRFRLYIYKKGTMLPVFEKIGSVDGYEHITLTPENSELTLNLFYGDDRGIIYTETDGAYVFVLMPNLTLPETVNTADQNRNDALTELVGSIKWSTVNTLSDEAGDDLFDMFTTADVDKYEFFGSYTVVECVYRSYYRALSDSEIDAMIGTELIYDSDYIQAGEFVMENPYYYIFLDRGEDNNGDEGTEYLDCDVYVGVTTNEKSYDEFQIGHAFCLYDANTIYLPADGVIFKAVRKS